MVVEDNSCFCTRRSACPSLLTRSRLDRLRLCALHMLGTVCLEHARPRPLPQPRAVTTASSALAQLGGFGSNNSRAGQGSRVEESMLDAVGL